MVTAKLDELETSAAWSEDDASIRPRDAYPLFWGTGTASSSIVYFELDRGRRLGAHVHSAEEIVLVVEGTVEISVADERRPLPAGVLAVVPPQTRHDVCATSELARCIGFFPAGATVTVFEQALSPSGSRVQGTPPADEVLDERG